ncbi:hypothetical protein chiPu_0032828, partial [Chiloscyllium punctatum]|nr:hypothetical protein [Chiloscyllium punctatum]
MLGRQVQAEMIGLVHGHERRHVEGLVAVVPDACVASVGRRHISVACAERVVNLINDRRELARVSVAEIEAEGIKTVAECPRHAEQLNPPAGQIDTRLFEMPLDLSAQWRCSGVAVIAVVQCEQVEPVVREKPQPR